MKTTLQQIGENPMKNIHANNRSPAGSSSPQAHPVSESERRKAKAIASLLSGGSRAREARLMVQVMAVLSTFGGTISHVELASPQTQPSYAPQDYTQDPEEACPR
jgi:hypothetical protein